MSRPIALYAALILLTCGCQSSQDAGGGMQVTRTSDRINVPVELDDYVIRMPATIPAGNVTFNVKNVGEHKHNIKIAGQGIETQLPQDLGAGQSTTLQVGLAAGEYKVTCPVGAHSMMGMRMDLTVTP